MKIGTLLETFCGQSDPSLICQRCGMKYDPIFNCQHCKTPTVWDEVQRTGELRRRALQRCIAARYAVIISSRKTIKAIRSKEGIDSHTAETFARTTRWNLERLAKFNRQRINARNEHTLAKLMRVMVKSTAMKVQ